MQAILNFDWAVFQWIEKLWTPVLTTVMTVLSTIGDNGIIWIALGIFLMVFKKTRKAGFVVLIAVACSGILNSGLLKELIQRPRPFNIDWGDGRVLNYPDFVERPTSYSFPSGHTSASFAAAMVLWYYLKTKAGLPAMVLAAGIGFSRIYVHDHYATDVIAGAAAGILYGLIAIFMFYVWETYIYPKVREVLFKKKRN